MTKQGAEGTIPRGGLSFDRMLRHLEQHRGVDGFTADWIITLARSVRTPCATDLQVISLEPTLRSYDPHTWPLLDDALAWVHRNYRTNGQMRIGLRAEERRKP